MAYGEIMKLFVAVLCITSIAFSQIEKIANDETYSCTPTLIIQPELKRFSAMEDEKDGIIDGANYALANAIGNKIKGSKIIKIEDFNNYDNCDSKVYLVKVVACNKLAAHMGQNQFEMKLEIMLFDSVKSKAPSWESTVEATGKRHWGTKEPIQSVINRVVRRIGKAI